MNKQSIVLSILGIVTSALILAPSAYAQSCTTQYGGTTGCTSSDLTVNKQVKNPITNVYVENLGSTDAVFSPGSEVWYRLIIKNTSGQTLNAVTVRDILPAYLTYIAGPGTYNSATRTLTFPLTNVAVGETTVEIMARVADTNQFPTASTLVRIDNYADVRALDRFDSDVAQSYIQTSVLGTTTLPVAGFNDMLLLLPFAGVGLTGFALLKKKS